LIIVKGGNPASGGRQHPFKGGRRGRSGGGSGEVERRVERHEEGGWLPPAGGSSGGAATAGSGPTVTCSGGVCPHSGGQRRVADEQARLAVGGHGACVGRPGKEMEWAEPGENAKWARPR
jgi:hypothetical protein